MATAAAYLEVSLLYERQCCPRRHHESRKVAVRRVVAETVQVHYNVLSQTGYFRHTATLVAAAVADVAASNDPAVRDANLYSNRYVIQLWEQKLFILVEYFDMFGDGLHDVLHERTLP